MAAARGGVGRLWTFPIHIAFSVLVLQVFQRGNLRWLWLAIAAHTLVNMTLSVPVMLGLEGTGAILLVEGLVAGGVGLVGLRKAYLSLKPSDYLVLRIAMGGALVYICIIFFGLPYLPSALLGIAAYIFVPKLVFASRRSAYTKALNAQLTEITLLLANSLQAGMSIQQGMSQVVERGPEPAKNGFRQTYNELQLGDNLAQSLQNLRQRINSRDLAVVVNAIVIQYQAGGNLARVLTAMSNILTERNRLASEINSLTAEARFSALIVMIIPVALLLMLRTTPLGEALFTSVIGWVLLRLFGLSQLDIFVVIQRMSRIEV